MRLLLAMLALAGMLSSHAYSHDEHGNPNWIANGNYRSPIDAEHCCGISDCVAISADDVTKTAGGYHIRGLLTYGIERREGIVITPGQMSNVWVDEDVPQAQVQVSRDGQYWRCKKPDGSRRCFFAPPNSM